MILRLSIVFCAISLISDSASALAASLGTAEAHVIRCNDYEFRWDLADDSIVFLQALWLRTSVKNVGMEPIKAPLLVISGPLISTWLEDELHQAIPAPIPSWFGLHSFEGKLDPAAEIVEYTTYRTALWDPYGESGSSMEPGRYYIAVTLNVARLLGTASSEAAVDTIRIPFQVSPPLGEDAEAYDLLKTAYAYTKAQQFGRAAPICEQIMERYPRSALTEDACRLLYYFVSEGLVPGLPQDQDWTGFAQRAILNHPEFPLSVMMMRNLRDVLPPEAFKSFTDSLQRATDVSPALEVSR